MNGDNHAVPGWTERCIEIAAQTTNRQSWPGKRMPVQKFLRQFQFTADLPHFVFVEGFQWLDNASALNQPLNARDPIVMRLDQCGLRRAARFDRVGIDRSLS